MAWRLVSQWNLGAWAEHQGQEQPQAHPDDDEPPRERGRGVLPEPAPRRHQKDHRPRGSAQRLPGASRLAPTVTPRRGRIMDPDPAGAPG